MRKVFLFWFTAFVLTTTVQAQSLVINEFMASNDSTLADQKGEYDDWIEIYNPGTSAVDIGGMYITDDLTDPTAWQIPTTAPDSTTVPPGGFLLLWADKQPEQGVLHVQIKLRGKGEQIGLFASDGATPIDTLTFSKQTTDISMGRFPDGSDYWITFEKPTPGYTNRKIPVVINEFMASNDTCCTDEHGDYDDWVELFNVGTKPINVGGLFLTDDLTNPTQWQIPTIEPDSTTIPPGGHLVFWADKKPEEGVLHTNFKLSGKGEQIGLFSADTSVIDSLSFGAQFPDTSYGRLTDGTNRWTFFATPTPGASNANGEITSVTEAHYSRPVDFVLLQNYPNPFNPSTNIFYNLQHSAKVELIIYNTKGQKIVTLVNDNEIAGTHRLTWNGQNTQGELVSAGLYFCQLKLKGRTVTSKMLLVK